MCWSSVWSTSQSFRAAASGNYYTLLDTTQLLLSWQHDCIVHTRASSHSWVWTGLCTVTGSSLWPPSLLPSELIPPGAPYREFTQRWHDVSQKDWRGLVWFPASGSLSHRYNWANQSFVGVCWGLIPGSIPPPLILTHSRHMIGCSLKQSE